MRKFKHKITGYIATETNSEKNYKVSEPKNFTIPKWIIENSEDWEEIKEFPKIISLQHINRLKIITDKTDIEAWLEGHGTRFWQIYQVAVSENEVFTLGDRVTYKYRANYAPWIIDNFFIRADGKILARSKSNSICEIVSEIEKAPEPLFITEDGVEIFEGGKVWYIHESNMFNPIFTNANPQILSWCNVIIFSTKKAAEDWIAKNKQKDLQYYEDLLLNPVEIYPDYTFCTFNSTHYAWLKNTEPKLYWLKVLEAIQQDLDDGWKPDWNHTSVKWRIYISHGYYEVSSYITLNTGLTCFKSEESAQKAVQIMGDKLDIIFK